MSLENLNKIVPLAEKSNIPKLLVNQAKRIATLEVEEDPNCPVPDCLATLLEMSISGPSASLALLELAKILDLRDQHFTHPDGDVIVYPH